MDSEKENRLNEMVKARQFELSACLPISWKYISLNLKHAADLLYTHYYDGTTHYIERLLQHNDNIVNRNGTVIINDPELDDLMLDGALISVYYMLMGYAIENLLKGILMIQHPEYFKPEAKLVDIQDHDLTRLCNKCNIVITQDEANLLNKLKNYILWQGKYPIPLKLDDMWPKRQPNGTWKTQGEAFHGRKQQQEVDSLYSKFRSELEKVSNSQEFVPSWESE